MNYRCGKEPFSVINGELNEMNKKTNQLPPDSVDIIAPNDILSQVLGPDKYKRVHMLGGGIHAINVWGEHPNRTDVENMQNQLTGQGKKIEELETLVMSMRNNSFPRDSESLSMGSNPSNGVRVHASVSILSLLDNSKIVAKIRIVSTDPTSRVGGQALGKSWCEKYGYNCLFWLCSLLFGFGYCNTFFINVKDY
ncbi:hypothetical protein M9H77_04122 [Catharanthus roseus]|uniref:Uncharacterized protein n=1 Tax=Catharanthus roseus TaxID=4058 RepID=A0ACC0CD67_CATRO|nr:hypothetical protein M9H77_04122 [Catharanthus roseus]